MSSSHTSGGDVPKAIARRLLNEELERRAQELRERTNRVGHRTQAGEVTGTEIGELRVAMEATQDLLDTVAELEGIDRWSSGRKWGELTEEERREVEQLEENL